MKLFTRPLHSDDGREVHLVEVCDGVAGAKVSKLAVKHWAPNRLSCNTAQVFNELRARMSSLSHSQYVVLPLHVSTSREGGMTMVYPYAGTNLDTVCAALRVAGQKGELLTQLAQMATSVLLTLQKLQAQKPQAWVHRDVKLSNLLLGEDGLVRLADFGCLGDVGDTTTAHDPTYFPPDWAALLPDGRHMFEDAASLAAANTHVLDLRGLGMALIQGYAGRLPAEVALDGDAGQLSTGGNSSSSSVSQVSTPCGSRCFSSSSSGAGQFDAQEKGRLLRIAHHDWRSSIDQLIPDAPALNQFAKLLMGPREAVPPLSTLLQQPLIKAVHRQVLDTARRARKPWLAHVAACRAAAWRVVAPLMQLEQQLLQVHSDGTLCSMPPFSEQLELLAEQQQEQLEGQAEAAGVPAPDSGGASPDGRGTSPDAAAVAAPACGDLQATVSAAMLQLAAARPEAAARIAELQQELLQLAAGAHVLEPPGACGPLRPRTPVQGLPGYAAVMVLAQQEAGGSAGQPSGMAAVRDGAASALGQEMLQVSTPTAGHPAAGAVLAEGLLGLGTPRIGEAAAPTYAGSVGSEEGSQRSASRPGWGMPVEDARRGMQCVSATRLQHSPLFARGAGLGLGLGLGQPCVEGSANSLPMWCWDGSAGCDWAGGGCGAGLFSGAGGVFGDVAHMHGDSSAAAVLAPVASPAAAPQLLTGLGALSGSMLHHWDRMMVGTNAVIEGEGCVGGLGGHLCGPYGSGCCAGWGHACA